MRTKRKIGEKWIIFYHVNDLFWHWTMFGKQNNCDGRMEWKRNQKQNMT
jgi:hypothetical protein